MRASSGETSFAFVNYEGPKLPRDPSVRGLIHRRAMRDVAVTRKKRGHRQPNVGQCPLFSGPEIRIVGGSPGPGRKGRKTTSDCQGEDSETGVGGESEHEETPRRPGHMVLLPAMGLGFTMPIDFSILFSLAPLTGLRLGFAPVTLSTSTRKTKKGSTLPNMGSEKLLTFIPSRYGRVSSLSHATDCVVAKLQQISGSPANKPVVAESTILLHYNKALRALQADLDDEVRCMTPETLCATQLLCIFELLRGTTEAHSWARHAGGAARLIEVRGAHRFTTEFELALFTAHLGPTVTEAFLSNKACSQTEESWKQVMRAAISSDESFAGQHDLVFDLWSHLVGGPGRFRETTDLICSDRPPPQHVVDELVDSLHTDRNLLVNWLRVAQQREGMRVDGEVEAWLDESIFPPAVLATKFDSDSGGVAGDPKRAILLALKGTYILCRILKARMLVALAPARFHYLELECQRLAERMVGLKGYLTENVDGGGLVGSFFMSQSAWAAKGILETRQSWGEGWDKQGMIERWKFEAWCKAIGRKFPGMDESIH